MHGIIMVPPSSPYESVVLEDLNDFQWNPVLVADAVSFCHILVGPQPIVRPFDIDINGDSVTVSAHSFGSTDFPPIESGGALKVVYQLRIA